MSNEHWKNEALKRFPECMDQAPGWETPYMLWFDLTVAFELAYKTDPRDEQLIRRVYEFADWCVKQSQGSNAENDLITCVAVCFYEHIPETPEALKDMPRWFSRDDVLEMKDIFSYHAGEEGFQKILQAFDAYPEKVLRNASAKKRRTA